MQCSIFYLFQECAEKICHCIPDNGLHSPHLKNATDKKHYFLQDSDMLAKLKILGPNFSFV
jgi:hypothetical protein